MPTNIPVRVLGAVAGPGDGLRPKNDPPTVPCADSGVSAAPLTHAKNAARSLYEEILANAGFRFSTIAKECRGARLDSFGAGISNESHGQTLEPR